MTVATSLPHRRAVATSLVAAFALGACTDRRLRGDVGPLTEAPQPEAPKGATIGAGSVKVALILPLTGSAQAAQAAQSLRNAAELAMAEFQTADLTILVKDDRGTPDGAREAATQALADGAELIMGPLFAPAVASAGRVAREAGRPVIAFSTDTTVASRGIYLLSFTPQPEVERVIDYASSQGRRSLAALLPETVYGNVIEAEFREAAARRGLRVVGIERYQPGQPGPAVQRLASVIGGEGAQADSLMLAEAGDGLVTIGSALQGVGHNPARVKPLGTGVWNDPRVTRVPTVAGGWYASPDQAGFAAFAGRYRAKFGSEPARLATLSYDAVSLAAALGRNPGGQRYTDSLLLATTGFSGVDGTFRFRSDGTNDRTLAVLEIRNGATTVVSPAPRTLAT